MRPERVVMALDQDLNETGPADGQLPTAAWWWVSLVPPPMDASPEADPGVYEADSYVDAVELGNKLLDPRPGYGVLIVAFHPEVARTVLLAAVMRTAEWSQVLYTEGDLRRAVVMLNVANTAMQRVRDRQRAKFVETESAKVPPPLPAGPDLRDHLYQNKVSFPDVPPRPETAPAGDVAGQLAKSAADFTAGVRAAGGSERVEGGAS